jgi:hypothetical protein
MRTMKTLINYDAIPKTAVYIGSEDGGGSLDEFTYDLIENADEPVRYRDSDGINHYFELINLY